MTDLMTELTSQMLAESIVNPSPPSQLSDYPNAPLLKAMWLLERGHFDAAHSLAQEDDTENGAWVHAHVHRVEGDLDNAGYWYGRAGRPKCTDPLMDEWHAIVEGLLVLRAS